MLRKIVLTVIASTALAAPIFALQRKCLCSDFLEKGNKRTFVGTFTFPLDQGRKCEESNHTVSSEVKDGTGIIIRQYFAEACRDARPGEKGTLDEAKPHRNPRPHK